MRKQKRVKTMIETPHTLLPNQFKFLHKCGGQLRKDNFLRFFQPKPKLVNVSSFGKTALALDLRSKPVLKTPYTPVTLC